MTRWSPITGRREFIKIGVAAVAGAAIAGGGAFVALSGPSAQKDSTINDLNSKLTDANSKLTDANAKAANLQSQLTNSQSALATAQTQLTDANSRNTALQGTVNSLDQVASSLITLSQQEAQVIEAAAETIIPTDSSGPGAKEAGVIFFIDKMLWGEYGKNGNMYNKAPFVLPGTPGPLTVGGITYPAGTQPGTLANGYGYGYAMNLRTFWRLGVDALDKYAQSAYGGPFASLSADNKAKALADLAGGKPDAATFNNIRPVDFFRELFFMTWSGFEMDPMYGGNRGMVGWLHTGFNGLNSGNFYGEGKKVTDLMVATSPTRLQPASLQQFQKKLGLTGGP
jgi:gluconate 2-dehydrogenase gamma chain